MASMAAVSEEPEWFTLYRARAPAEEVANVWFQSLGPEARQEAKDDAPTARARLRRTITDSPCAEVRADATNNWRYTGSVLRAADAVLGIPPPRATGHTTSAAPSGCGAPSVSRMVVPGDGQPGTLGLWWSDFGGACCLEQLRAKGVTCRLNVAVEAVNKFPDDNLEIVHVPMEDIFDEERSQSALSTWVTQLGEACQILRNWRQTGAVVNVSCQMGKNRSGAICLAWLCKECGWGMEQAVEHLRNVTFLACANPHLLKAVSLFLEVDAVVPLNPAGDGGGWICISPPGTPRAGGTQAFEDTARQALEKLSQNNVSMDAGGGNSNFEAERADHSDSDQECGEVVPLFADGDLSDVD